MRLIKCLVLIFVAMSSSLYCQQRYKEKVFEELKKESFTYKEGLDLDIYQAVKDSSQNRPVLLLVHGGGFASGQRNGKLESDFMKQMAQYGYVGVSMSYRLLRKGQGFGCDCPASEKETTFLEATRDIYAATQYLKDHSKKLRINPSEIILVGSSAGAEAVLNAAFMQQTQAYEALREAPISYAGLISFAGAILDADQIQSNNAIPSLLFHGKKDNLVPFGRAAHHYCKKKEIGHLILEGSRTIARKLRKQGATATLVKAPKGNHDWASIPYSKTDIISDFLYRTIIKKETYPKRITLKNPL